MAELSQILKQATGVLALVERVFCSTTKTAADTRLHRWDRRDQHRPLPSAGGPAAQRQVATLIHAQYTTVMHRPLLTLVERLGEVLPRVWIGCSSPTGQRGHRGGAAAQPPGDGPAECHCVPWRFPRRDAGRRVDDHVRHQVPLRFSPLMGGVHVSPFPDPGHFGWPVEQATDFALNQLDYVLQTLSPPADTAAFFVEPVLGEGGYVPANERFLTGLRDRADAYGILLVLDEVQTGFGRTGKFWGGEHFNARPDIVVTAKGLASGFPLSQSRHRRR